MSDVLKFRSATEVEEEAARWIWRLDDEDAPVEVRNDFEQWLRRDQRHRRAFEELGGVWRSLDDLAEAKREERVATFVAEEKRLYTVAKPTLTRGWLRQAAPWAMAASLAIAVGVVSWFQRGNEAQTLSTAVGQQRSAMLADGSTVQLNTNTILETRFNRERRVVVLRKGEASFNVARNPERPFLVHAGDMVVRAVGTEFNVRVRDTRDIEVIVTEGKVTVGPQGEGGARIASGDGPEPALPARRELAAGQRLETTAAAVPVVAISPVVLSNTLAWREGAIVFDGEPLGQAIAELNRYSDTRLIIIDSSIHDLRVGGRFRTGDIDGFLEALTKAFPVTTRRTSDNLVYIQARVPASSALQ
ncbi:FecR domain-containing protein [Luteimonas sp. SJ-92]|uniref:FecR domain-containing protein n=1 Tax=Luteimonas salinisoli TaxID=2752307 RepID=A0A853JH19_9GAMM|nr:FecR domain-containing protein [Luteimonas salinisoli]NZA27718.1 FecR domain-containing protein [Luteimonas salinisoli]